LLLPKVSKIVQGRFRVLSNIRVGADYFKMTVFAPAIAQQAHSGQFVHLLCLKSTQPLLRRPFSFHRLHKNNFEILYKIIGLGTNLLAKKKKGDIIDILGPLGNGFNSLRTTNYESQTAILVAGGMGVAPLLALAEEIVQRKKTKLYVLIGSGTRKCILCEKDFKRLKAEVLLSTEDGSQGRKGLITDCLKSLLSTVNCSLSTIYACGPKSMLKEIARISGGLHISAWASLEENMACGVGACLGCVIETSQGYRRICKDGPVFNLGEIRWEGGKDR
jgi:dihydroorotate dehydrogenase electron transfer subunit